MSRCSRCYNDLLPSLLADWSPQALPVCRLDDDLPPLELLGHPGALPVLPIYCRAGQVGLLRGLLRYSHLYITELGRNQAVIGKPLSHLQKVQSLFD